MKKLISIVLALCLMLAGFQTFGSAENPPQMSPEGMGNRPDGMPPEGMGAPPDGMPPDGMETPPDGMGGPGGMPGGHSSFSG